MAKKQLGLIIVLLASSWPLYAMGRTMKEDPDDQTFNAKAVGTTPSQYTSDTTSEKNPVGLPAKPSAVEKDTAKDFSDPFFKETEKDPDLQTDKSK